MVTPSPSAPRELILTRTFAAPRSLVWKTFTEPAHLDKWWGPKGFTTRTLALDLRSGGIFHYHMRTPDGQDWWGKWVYREVVAPEKLVYVLSFSDAKGGLVHHPLSPTWPLEMLGTMTLADRNGQTLLTQRLIPLGADPTELATFAGGFDSMDKGFNATWDQLAEYLTVANG